jgi:glutathione synthase/RimK-type ligase-like ATP-grasp enzyme
LLSEASPAGLFRLGEQNLQPLLGPLAVGRLPPPELPGLIGRCREQPASADALMQLFFILSTLGQHAFALETQARALALNRLYRLEGPRKPAIRLLAFMAPGDLADSMPLDFLVEGSDIRIDLLYLVPGQPLPAEIPDHDVAIVAAGESGRNRPILDWLETLAAVWPRPVLNDPARIRRCARDEVARLLQGVAGLLVPRTRRVDAGQARQAAFPYTLRPVDTHAGEGLARIGSASDCEEYLTAHPGNDFYLASWIDYRSDDGLYRKARVALIDGRPFACHLAISEHWIVHYISADMQASAVKRAQEAAFLNGFENGFAVRHCAALQAIASRLGLDHVVLDCAETPDGQLLLFEADNRGWIHATDPEALFPYKRPVMQKAFDAFRTMLLTRSRAGNRFDMDQTAPR